MIVQPTFEPVTVTAQDQLPVPQQNGVEWSACSRNRAGKKADRHVTSRPRILNEAKQFLIGKVGSHSSFLTFTKSGRPTRYMKLIWPKHKIIQSCCCSCWRRTKEHQKSHHPHRQSKKIFVYRVTDCLTQVNNRTRLDPKGSGLNFVLHCPNKDEPTKELLQYQEKGTEVDERTAEAHSKQENTDITELVLIDDMTVRCLPRKQCQGKVLLHMWINSARVTSSRERQVYIYIYIHLTTRDDSLKQLAVAERKNTRSCRISLSLQKA